jgi:sialic acid synthase SpsE
MQWFATGFDAIALDFLESKGQTIWKIPSGFIGNERYYRLIKDRMGEGDRVFISTGMATAEEVKEVAYKFYPRDVVLMQCTSQYPTPDSDVNLNAITYLSANVGILTGVGLSYHGHKVEIPAAAVALGAEVVEVHITTDRSLPGADHAASMEVAEFKAMVNAIRTVELAMGTYGKKPTERELKFKDKIRNRMRRAIE